MGVLSCLATFQFGAQVLVGVIFQRVASGIARDDRETFAVCVGFADSDVDFDIWFGRDFGVCYEWR